MKIAAATAALPLLLCAVQAANTPAPAPQQAETQQPSAAEKHIRAGLLVLAKIHDELAKVQDRDTAEAAVPPLMRLGEELTLWAKATAAMQPLSDLERMEMEDRYMPVIKRLNNRIQSQGARIAAAEFYGSRNLPAALVHIVQSTAQ
ncbi:MAG: hypothetical protein Q4C88_07660 [Akkermansia sp.]|nr:hypothetical protein [Akkermansia sp.]